ncbi:MAG: hypothetical protein FWF25_06315 [Propionibacteriaceae bacterium]|nr:hypothetical protein [Propionibacteriaceae bacterium]
MTFRKKLVTLGTIGIVGLSLAACSSGGGTTTSDTTSDTPGSTSTQDDQVSTAPLTFNTDNLLAGTASPSFLSGDPGDVSVVAQGTLETTDSGSILPIAFQNNTDAAISSIDWSAQASSGSEVATGMSEGSDPAQLQPGEVGLAYITFDATTATPAPDATYTFSAETSPADTSSMNNGSLTVTDPTIANGAMTGTAVNNTGASFSSPISVTVYCFSAAPDYLLQTAHTGYADQSGDIAADASTTFTVDLAGDTCDSYLVGASGIFS